MVFRIFWTLTKKTCIFTEKFLAGLSKLLFTCPEKHLRSNVSERKSWKIGDFRIISEVFGTMAENIFQVWQNSNRCPEGTDYWKTFPKIKNSFSPFLRDFLLWAKKFARFAEPAIYGSVEAFGEILFEISEVFHTYMEFLPKNPQLEILFRGVTTAMRASRLEAYFEEREVFKTKFFLFICFGVWANF